MLTGHIWPESRPGTPQLPEAGWRGNREVELLKKTGAKTQSIWTLWEQRFTTHMLQNPTDSTELEYSSSVEPLALPPSTENAPTTFEHKPHTDW